MFAIKYKDEYLDLLDGSSLSMDEESSFFTQDTIPGPYVFPTEIANTKANQRRLGHPAVISNRTVFRRVSGFATIEVNGTAWFTGSLYVLNTGSSIKINIRGQNSDRYFSIKEKNLPEIFDDTNPDYIIAPPAIGLRYQFIGSWLAASAAANVDTLPYVFAPIDTTEYSNTSGRTANSAINEFGSGGFSGGDSHAINPFLYLVYVIDEIMEAAGYSYSSDFFNEEEIRTLVIYSAAAKEPVYMQGYTGTTAPNDKFFFKHHVPQQMTVSSFLNEIKNYFRLGFFFDFLNPGHIIIKSFKEIFESTDVLDLTDIAAPYDSVNFDDLKSTGFTLKSVRDSNDALAVHPQQKVVADGSEEVEYKIDQMQMVSPPTHNFRIPQVSQELVLVNTSFISPLPSSHAYELANFNLRLMFYRGYQPSGLGYDYPMLSTDDKDPAGNTAFNYSLAWDGPNGLYQRLHREAIELLLNSSTTKERVYPNLEQLSKIRLFRKIRIKENIFLIKKAGYTLKNNSDREIEVDLELFKL